jgi:hypothetical protein
MNRSIRTMSFLGSFLHFVRNASKASYALCIAATLTAAAQTATQVTIQAKGADQFVGSMGINVHMENTSPPYNNYLGINQQLQSLGMRNFRDEMNQADPYFKNKSFIDEINKIGGLGYSLTGLIEGGNDYPEPVSKRLEAAHVVPMILNLWPTIAAVEGPNEPDDTPPPFAYGGPCDPKKNETAACYPLGAIEESEDLYQIVKRSHLPGSEKIHGLPVLAMSEGTATNFTVLAKLVKENKIPPPSWYTSAGNMHAYQAGWPGDGLGPNSSLDWYIRISQEWTGSEPLWTTEMGYHNNTYYLDDGEQQGVSEQAAATYLPAAFLAGFNQRVVRTFSYELIDEKEQPPLANCPLTSNPTSPQCMGYGYYGLLRYDLKPKPAFAALVSLIQILQEPGAQFDPGSLTMTFSANPATNPYKPEYVLLEKSNGNYYLAIWNDIKVFQPAMCKETNPQGQCTAAVPGQDVPTENVPVTISFREAQSFTVYAPSDATGSNPTSAYTLSTTPMSIQINLPPEVLIIRIASAGA